MANYVQQHLHDLKKRHYILLANQAGHWFNASPNVLGDYATEHGSSFCLVLYRNGPSDDAYVLPYRSIRHVLTEENLARGTGIKGRWHGSIRDGYLDIRGSDEAISVSQYHNAFHLLAP